MKTTMLRTALRLSLLLFCSLTALSYPVAANDPAPGIQFFTGTWKELLAEAKKQNKPIFVDVYTTWCGPCKQMAKEAFPDKTVGEKFNTNFISYQLDAEKGEGPTLAKQYGVVGFPTSLYVSASGDLVHRTMGYGGIKGVLDEADKALLAAKDPKPLSVWESEYRTGKRDVGFLRSYLTKAAQLGMPKADALDEFLKVLPEAEQTTPDNLRVIKSNFTTTNSKAFAIVTRAMTGKTDGPPDFELMQTLSMAIQRDEQAATTEEQFQRVRANSRKVATMMPQPMGNVNDQLTEDFAWLGFYERTKNVSKYRVVAIKIGQGQLAISDDSLSRMNRASYARFQEETKMTPDSMKQSEMFVKYDKMMQSIESQQVMMRLNNLASTYTKLMKDRADLNQALVWSARSVAIERDPMVLGTYAQLLHKLGRKSEAIKHQEEAITLLKAKGEDTAEVEKVLAVLKK